MRIVKTPFIVKKIFPNVVWSRNSSKKAVYLTFDDGPTLGITNWVLQELKKYNALATFFCIGKNVEQNSSVYQNILKEGHSVGNHTFRHLNAWETNSKIYTEDVNMCSQFVRSNLFRPPYGKITPSIVKALKSDYKIILWDIISYDFDASITAERCYNNVVKNVENGSIIVFHDSEKAFKNLKVVLPKVLAFLYANGYEMKGLEM